MNGSSKCFSHLWCLAGVRHISTCLTHTACLCLFQLTGTCQGPKLRNPRGQFVCDLKEGTHQQYSQLSYPPIINRILDHLLDHKLENLLCAEELAAPDHTTPGRRSGPRVEKLLQTLLLYWDYLGVG